MMGRSMATRVGRRGLVLTFALGIVAVAFVASSPWARALELGMDTQPPIVAAVPLACTPYGPVVPVAPLPGSCFEGYDGTQVDSDGTGVGNERLDWESVLGITSSVNDFTTVLGDSQFGPGGDEETPDGWTFDVGSLGSDNYDIISGYLVQEPNVEDLFLGLGFVRGTDNGTSHMAFELNQLAPGYRSAIEDGSGRVMKVPTRSAGDLLITYSVDPPVIGLCRWSGNQHTGHWLDLVGNAVAGSDCPALASGLVQAAMNASTITAANNYLQGNANTLAAKTFAEASINLSEALKGPDGDADAPDACVSFSYMWMHSRSSISITSNQQDYILPDGPTNVANCATVSIVKDANPNGPQDFDFTGSFGAFRLDDDADATLPGSRTFTVSGAGLGLNTITETPTTGWQLTDISCSEGSDAGATASITVDPGDEITCTFTNEKDATLTIVKDANPNGFQDFGFSVTGTGFSNFSLDDDGDETNTLRSSAVFLFYGDAFGTKTVTEAPVAGWDLSDLTCSEGLVVGTTATVVVDPGDQITCTYTNTELADATLTIVKDSQPDDPQDFDFSVTGTGFSNFSLDDDGDETNTLKSTAVFLFYGDAFGTKTVSESPVGGWALSDLTCSEGLVVDATATIQVDPGDQITCTFTNTKIPPATLTIIKVTDPASDPQDFDFDLTGQGVFADLDLDTDAGDATLPSQVTYPGSIGPQGPSEIIGAYTITESAVAGWQLTGLECTGAGGDSSTSLADRSATLDIDPGEDVVCTFTNTKAASLTIVKDAVPNAPDDFGFTVQGVVAGPFELDDDGDGELPNSLTIVNGTQGFGVWTITEGALAGWALSDLECTGDIEAQTNLQTRTATVDVDAGETVVCTFTNTKIQPATLTIIKVTDPASDPQDFDFDLTGQGVFADLDLDTDAGDATLPSQVTYPGSIGPQGPSEIIGAYTITESAVAGWQLTGLECTGAGGDSSTSLADRSATLDIDPGEDVVCTFTNTKNAVVVPSPSPTQDQADITSRPSQSDTFTEQRPDSAPRPLELLAILIGLIAAAGVIVLSRPTKRPR
jgi:plastocyanin